jgi:hypothetical protein
MGGTLDNREDREGTMEGSKKRKIMGGLLWGASLGLPEAWKEEIRHKLGGPYGPEDTGYWGRDEDREDRSGGKKKGPRQSTRLMSKGKGKK